ncbi:MAG: hypothetical protein GY796_24450 [Chloroflexi bacterium]|nr:hypothetical protein [Chloroflexota bacterium]
MTFNETGQALFTYDAAVTTTYHNDNMGLSQVLMSDDGTTQTTNLFGLDLIFVDDGTEQRVLLTDGLGSGRVEMVGSYPLLPSTCAEFIEVSVVGIAKNNDIIQSP